MVTARGVKYQYLAGICVNLLTMSYGAFCGWGSASFLTLQSSDSPLETGPLSNEEMGSVAAMLCAGGTIGTVVFAWAADKIGRKHCLLLAGVPSLLGWFIIPFATNPTHLLISRFLGGFSGGGAFAVVPLFTTELAEDSMRGVLGTLLVLSCNAGVLLAFILGHFLLYNAVAWIISLLCLVFFMTFSFLPETPQYLMKINENEQAQKSLQFYRGLSEKQSLQIQSEFEKLRESDPQSASSSVTWTDFYNRPALKALLIGVGLMVLNQFCGAFAMVSYTASIFKESGSSLSPTSAAIVVGAIQFIGSYLATLLVERAGRKLLLTASAVGSGIGLACFGAYSYLVYLGYNTEAFSWVPLVSFSLTIFIASWGIVPLPYLVLAEVSPPKIRDYITMISMVILWMLAFVMIRYTPVMTELIGMHGLMLFFSGSCFAGAAFILIYVPETKGKSIEAILAML